MRLAILLTLFLSSITLLAQKPDDLQISISYSENEELRDLMLLEDINYLKISIAGKNIRNQHPLFFKYEYWKGMPVMIDTILNGKPFHIKNNSDTITLRMLSKQAKKDTVNFNFNFPWLSTIVQYKTVAKNMYSLRPIINAGEVVHFSRKEPATLFVYTLPYEDPKNQDTCITVN
jgi:hypothetical protein